MSEENQQFTSDEDPKSLFELLQVIGQGAYGVVQQALSLETSEIVAVKIIPLQSGESSNSVMKEVNFMRELSQEIHPNIVNFLGAYHDKENNDIWIAMDYCSAGSLTDLMKAANRSLDEEEAACVMKQAIQALIFLHERKIIHRDVKANNLLVTDEGEVKLADFGVSYQLQQTCEKRKSVIGTPYWCAPEIFAGQAYGIEADTWSLGITFIEMLEGKPPLAGIHPMRAMLLIPKEPAPSLKGRKSPLTHREFSGACVQFAERMLQKEPSKRAKLHALLDDPFLQGATNLSALLAHRYDGRVSVEIQRDEMFDSVIQRGVETVRRSLEAQRGSGDGCATAIQQQLIGGGELTAIQQKQQGDAPAASAAAQSADGNLTVVQQKQITEEAAAHQIKPPQEKPKPLAQIPKNSAQGGQVEAQKAAQKARTTQTAQAGSKNPQSTKAAQRPASTCLKVTPKSPRMNAAQPEKKGMCAGQ